jgi:XRE family transcriptional regulator, aerobic/anaerobic benzoate catabolism transcriptional regulator
MSQATQSKRSLPPPEGPCETSSDLLKMLGGHVRDARARHGMTRRMLARDSHISERHLAELESGRGNFSIVLLKRLANAINVPLSELVDEGPRPSAEYQMLAQRLRRLEPRELALAASLIMKRFGRLEDRSGRVALVGLRGAGKTTLGTLLAKHLGWDFVELSRAIESEAGVTLAEIFEFGGQAAYRRYELRALEQVLTGKRGIVLAAGGGLAAETPAFERLLDACYTIWLQASPQEHWDRVIAQGDLRIRAGTRDTEALKDMERILAQRESLYRLADARLDTSGKGIPAALGELAGLVERRSGA